MQGHSVVGNEKRIGRGGYAYAGLRREDLRCYCRVNPCRRSLSVAKLRGLFTLFLPILLLCTFSLSCGGKPFNVKPRPDVPPPALASPALEAGGLTIQAEAVTDEDYLYETFDANLLLAGVLPVRAKVVNAGSGEIDLEKARFELRVGNGRAFKAVDGRRAFKRVVAYYQISTYSKDGYKESQADFSSYALDLKTPLGAGQSRQGIIFFSVPAEAGAGDLVLVARLGGKNVPPIELKLK